MNVELLGIGVGVPELVDPVGNISSAHTLAWQGDGVRAAFSSLAPAVVESDVRAGALAEAMFGAGRGYRLFVYVTVGTGISSTLVQDGRPFAGARGNALILASSPFTIGMQFLRHGPESHIGGVRQRTCTGSEIQPARLAGSGTG